MVPGRDRCHRGGGRHAIRGDFYNHRVQKFTPEGEFRVAFGSNGTGAGQFDRPTDVAVAPDGTLYVADFGNGRVEVFVPEQPAPEPDRPPD